MQSVDRETGLVCAAAMGILTVLLCLVVADGILGINRPPAGKNPIALTLFWVSLTVLPILFYKLTKWRYTLLNFPLYFLLYFPIFGSFGSKDSHYFLERDYFLDIFPGWMNALAVALLFWGVQSVVYLVLNLIFHIARQIKERGT